MAKGLVTLVGGKILEMEIPIASLQAWGTRHYEQVMMDDRKVIKLQGSP